MKLFTPRAPSAERREQIVAATLGLLAHTSIDALSTRQLARELGFSQPALFRHFASRDALLLATIAHARGELEAIAVRVVEAELGPIETLRALGRSLLEHVELRPGLPRLLFAMGSPAAASVRDALRHVVAMQAALVAELVRQGQRAGVVASGCDADAAATLYVGMLQGLVLRWEIAGRDAPLAPRFDEVFTLWLRAVEGASRGEAAPTTEARPPRTARPASNLASLDVRPLIARGIDPLGAILAALDDLPSGGALVLDAPFRPAPLLTLLARRGHAVSAEAIDETHWVVEIVVGASPEVDVLLDLEPPLPLERVLEATAALAPGGVYLARLPRHPRLLLPRLRERGVAFDVLERADGSALLRVERPR